MVLDKNKLDWIFAAISTMGPMGKVPKAPGTMGAVAALPIAWIQNSWPTIWVIVFLIFITMVSLYAVSQYIVERTDKDPKEVVVDEFIGCLIACAFVPSTWYWMFGAFLSFRMIDIFKPWPVSWIDKNLKNEIGVIGDDMAAGVMAGVSLLLIRFVLTLL